MERNSRLARLVSGGGRRAVLAAVTRPRPADRGRMEGLTALAAAAAAAPATDRQTDSSGSVGGARKNWYPVGWLEVQQL